MRPSICSSSVTAISILCVGIASALTPIGSRPAISVNPPSALSALPNSSSGGSWGSRTVPSKTARESAFNVEWEPMTELERRIEDGVNYEHISTQGKQRRRNAETGDDGKDDKIPSTRGVFVGYRYTEDEYNRLKSAEVCQ